LEAKVTILSSHSATATAIATPPASASEEARNHSMKVKDKKEVVIAAKEGSLLLAHPKSRWIMKALLIDKNIVGTSRASSTLVATARKSK